MNISAKLPARSAAVEKKDVQKLQRAIIDGLEDVKGQDIVVFDTEHITSLFERVIIASGTSNRQTKALAASVRDAVREAGFGKPRIEGEENGEWIIVDCGAAVAHIMQPTIRQYYHLEELWGDKPIKLKLGAPAPLVKAAKVEAPAAAVVKSKTAKPAKPGARAKPGAKLKPVVKAPVRIPTTTVDSSYVGRIGKTNDWTAKRNATQTAAEPVVKTRKAAAKTPIIKVPVAKKVAAKKVVAKTAAKTAAKAAPRSPAVKKPAAKKPAAKTAVPRAR